MTLPVALLWVLFAGWAAWMDFRIGPIAHAGLGLTSLYLLCAGAAQQLIYGREG